MGKNNKIQKSQQNILTLCYLPPLGILQAELKSVAVAAVCYVSLAVPRVSHADCWRHFFLIYHNETMHRLVLPVIHSVLISTLLMSQTGDFQLFRGWLLQCWTLKQLFCFSKVGHCHLSASLWFHHLVFYLMTVIVEGLNMLPLQIPPHQTACTKMYLSLYFPWELKKKIK